MLISIQLSSREITRQRREVIGIHMVRRGRGKSDGRTFCTSASQDHLAVQNTVICWLNFSALSCRLGNPGSGLRVGQNWQGVISRVLHLGHRTRPTVVLRAWAVPPPSCLSISMTGHHDGKDLPCPAFLFKQEYTSMRLADN